MSSTINRALVSFLFILLAACNSTEKEKDDKNLNSNISITSCKMKLMRDNSTIVANKTVTFKLKPVTQPNDTTVFLETIIQKKIHLIITNNDLSYFSHLFADIDSAGIYNISAEFPKGGEYVLMADYKAMGLQRQTDTFHIHVAGTPEKKIIYTTVEMLCNTDGYTLQLLSKKLVPGTLGMLVMKMTKDGQPVLPETLQLYLGEESHMVAINTVTKEYVQVNSKSDPMSYWFMLNFPRAGLYRTWIEFKSNNTLHLANFVIEVKPAS